MRSRDKKSYTESSYIFPSFYLNIAIYLDGEEHDSDTEKPKHNE